MALFLNGTDTVSINGLRLATCCDGSPDGPWMVFSNSLASTTMIWDAQIPAVTNRYRALRYDQRGHGTSQVGDPAGTTFDDLTGDFLALLDHYEINKAVFVGVSMGAVTVLRAAAIAPERCAAVVACDGAWRTAPGSLPMWRDRMAAVTAHGVPPLAKATVERWFQPAFIAANPDLAKRIEAMVAATTTQGYLACVNALMSYDYSADLPALRVPALFIAGADDGDMPQTLADMANATPGSRLRIIPECGHQPEIEQPLLFRQHLNSFLQDHALSEIL